MVAIFVMIHVWMYTKVYLSFEKFSMFLKVVLKVCCDVCFEKWQGLFLQGWSSNQELSTLIFSKIFLMF